MNNKYKYTRDEQVARVTSLIQKLLNEAYSRMDELETRRGCPCLYTTPCSYACSCANPVMSGGCERCASYGSPEQQKHAAERLAQLEKENARLRNILAEVAELGKDGQRLDAIQKLRLGIFYSPRYSNFFVQREGQTCGNIGRDTNVRQAIDAAIKTV